jgi:hypothetical protein
VSKLVCVEYAPKLDPRSNRNNDVISPLIGCVGETLERFLHPHERAPTSLIPVRFPLSRPGSRIARTHSEREPLDPYLLEVESIDVAIDSLYPIEDRVPTSLYTRIGAREPQYLFERPVYMSTFSRDGLLGFIKEFRKHYNNCWIWKWDASLEPGGNNSIYQPVFVEARVYGIDNVIGTYDARKFDGVALEIIYRPWPSQELIDQGTKILRSCSNVYLFSNSEEYINYVDGVRITREKTDYIHMVTKYQKFLTPSQGVALRKTSLLGTMKDKKEPLPPIKKAPRKAPTRPSSYAEVAAEAIQWIDDSNATTTGNTTNLGVWKIGESK